MSSPLPTLTSILRGLVHLVRWLSMSIERLLRTVTSSSSGPPGTQVKYLSCSSRSGGAGLSSAMSCKTDGTTLDAFGVENLLKVLRSVPSPTRCSEVKGRKLMDLVARNIWFSFRRLGMIAILCADGRVRKVRVKTTKDRYDGL